MALWRMVVKWLVGVWEIKSCQRVRVQGSIERDGIDSRLVLWVRVYRVGVGCGRNVSG